MKYLAYSLLLSLLLMAYWLIKDAKWFKKFTKKLSNFGYRVADFFTNIFERISDDIEVY